ncbi:MAG: tetratricopeptide repeat protein [Verrucomicrobia bacterium]|nr:tetratricopeptide repeat protein [Verrucomicrobiota bacterium]
MASLGTRLVSSLLGVILCMGVACAHDGPEHQIEVLSERLIREGNSADVLLERAIEYRVLGRLTQAVRDLERAVRLAPADSLVLRELAQIELQRGRVSKALLWVQRTLEIPDLAAGERSAVLMIRSHCRGIEGAGMKALEDCSEALRWNPQLVSAYLERSAWQRRLRLPQERILGLEEGIQRTGAGLLAAERIEALIDDGQWQQALEAVEPELTSSRLQGSWRIRRARALKGLGRWSEAERDLLSALEEIELRMPRQVKDSSLIIDRALARELLGQTEAAIQDYQLAAGCGGGEEALEASRRLRKTLTGRSVWKWCPRIRPAL